MQPPALSTNEAFQSSRYWLAAGDQRELVSWFRSNGRRYPWRTTHNSFHILCAEFMLRRTRSEQVVPVYTVLTRLFSGPREVLQAPEAETLALLRPLGLEWRARQFRGLCSALVDRHGGKVPITFSELVALPGISHYCAAAVVLFAFDGSLLPVDTNVLRVLSRYGGFPYTDSDRRKGSVLEKISATPVATDRRALWWAVIDLGALLCTPRMGRHEECPLRFGCAAVRGAGQAPVVARKRSDSVKGQGNGVGST